MFTADIAETTKRPEGAVAERAGAGCGNSRHRHAPFSAIYASNDAGWGWKLARLVVDATIPARRRPVTTILPFGKALDWYG